MHMELGLRQVLRQEIRLEQSLQLSLRMIEQLATDTEREIQAEGRLLDAMLRDCDRGTYASVEDFVDRVGKRVRKKDRTDRTRCLVAQIRQAVALLACPDLAAVRELVQYGRDGVHCWMMDPIVCYAQLLTVWESASCATIDLRRVSLDVLCGQQRNAQGSPAVLDFLVDCTADARCTASLFTMISAALHRSAPRVVTAYAHHLLAVLPVGSCTELQCANALELLAAYDHYLGHGGVRGWPTDALRAYVAGCPDAEATSATSSIPPLVRALLPSGTSDAVMERLAARFGEPALRDATDAVRHVLRALQWLRGVPMGGKYLAHAVMVTEHAKAFLRVIQAINWAAWSSGRGEECTYPLDARTAEEVVLRLRNHQLDVTLGQLPLRPEYRERFTDAAMQMPPKVLEIVLRLTSVYSTHAKDALPVLARIVEAIMDGEFSAWRYAHDAASVQLKAIKAHPEWQQRTIAYRMLGDAERCTETLRAVALLQPVAAAAFVREYHTVWSPDLGSKLEEQILAIEEQFRDGRGSSGDRRALAEQAKRLRTMYRAARCIELFVLEPATIDHARSVWREFLGQPWAVPFHDCCAQAIAILDQPELRAMQCVTVTETDDLLDLLQVGVMPTLTCQRWTEHTSYNHCLLAYVADPNKKLWQLTSRNGEVIGRVVVRLLPFKRSALLLMEPPYSMRWSDDHTRVLLGEVLRKAARLAKAVGKPIAVGYVGVRRWGEWGKMFEELAKGVEVKPVTANFQPKLPESFNIAEYSDSLGGCLPRGHVLPHVARLTYLLVSPEREAVE
ncbi:hypothetical protein HYV74_03310 [Candidatus Uhrbacteria bacterium]|nr:hypothetical protein [Candidatus Uhrbacteria bacterium]